MYHYRSDATQFLDQLIADNPELETERMENRNLLWDVELNPQEQAGFEAAKVEKQPYTYYQN
ncbi:DUF3460 family protein [Neisseria animalis]|uniref:DUF3460 family protein n=1 Tax=Neisseria animalis TaxID=492 RepID=A0A5P3MUH2_NEIAN|nr:DUF3460 family protein [Neisseria animalis]QEY24715.1 DUF3460 family protein [Neisseria animalis]ROW31691.1 DUF3460 family protein [Neisseria animalis]VEE07878.1 Protein of uncharacterised function (DUF3460) [Neisseria animalis]